MGGRFRYFKFSVYKKESPDASPPCKSAHHAKANRAVSAASFAKRSGTNREHGRGGSLRKRRCAHGSVGFLR